jgi:hypothetical protein
MGGAIIVAANRRGLRDQMIHRCAVGVSLFVETLMAFSRYRREGMELKEHSARSACVDFVLTTDDSDHLNSRLMLDKPGRGSKGTVLERSLTVGGGYGLN